MIRSLPIWKRLLARTVSRLDTLLAIVPTKNVAIVNKPVTIRVTVLYSLFPSCYITYGSLVSFSDRTNLSILGTTQSQERRVQELFPDGTFFP